MSLRSKLKLPREHGAWAMLYVPFVLGVAVAGSINGAVWLLLVATTALFIARESLLVWWRAHARGREAGQAGTLLLSYLALAAVASLPLILLWRLFWLVPMGLLGVALLLINGKQATRLEERALGSELLAICGLTLTAPAIAARIGSVCKVILRALARLQNNGLIMIAGRRIVIRDELALVACADHLVRNCYYATRTTAPRPATLGTFAALTIDIYS